MLCELKRSYYKQQTCFLMLLYTPPFFTHKCILVPGMFVFVICYWSTCYYNSYNQFFQESKLKSDINTVKMLTFNIYKLINNYYKKGFKTLKGMLYQQNNLSVHTLYVFDVIECHSYNIRFQHILKRIKTTYIKKIRSRFLFLNSINK